MNAKENSLLKQIGQQIKKLAKVIDEGGTGASIIDVTKLEFEGTDNYSFSAQEFKAKVGISIDEFFELTKNGADIMDNDCIFRQTLHQHDVVIFGVASHNIGRGVEYSFEKSGSNMLVDIYEI